MLSFDGDLSRHRVARRQSIALQLLWYVVAVFFFDCLLMVVSVVMKGSAWGPEPLFGNSVRRGYRLSRDGGVVLYANFGVLPKPTAVQTRQDRPLEERGRAHPRPRWWGCASAYVLMVACTK